MAADAPLVHPPKPNKLCQRASLAGIRECVAGFGVSGQYQGADAAHRTRLPRTGILSGDPLTNGATSARLGNLSKDTASGCSHGARQRRGTHRLFARAGRCMTIATRSRMSLAFRTRRFTSSSSATAARSVAKRTWRCSSTSRSWPAYEAARQGDVFAHREHALPSEAASD